MLGWIDSSSIFQGNFQGAFRTATLCSLSGEMLCICMFVLLSRVYAVMYVDDSLVNLCVLIVCNKLCFFVGCGVIGSFIFVGVCDVLL